LIYVPPVALLILAIALPQMGRDLIWKMNGRELALFLAFWWTILAVGLHTFAWIIRGLRHSRQARGFEVGLKSDRRTQD
jgi:hypothetical protein